MADDPSDAKAALHNSVAPLLLRQVLTAPEAVEGGSLTDSVIIVESLVYGLLLYAEANGNDPLELLETMESRIRERLEKSKEKPQ